MDYRIVQTKKQNLQLYSKLLSQVFTDTGKYSERFLEWQYYQNPAGDVLGYDAFYGDELAAHYVTIPVIYIWQNKRVTGLLSLNTATGKAHQGKGLFLQLARATYSQAEKQGYGFVIGVANQNSSHGFINKLGFKLISKLEVKVYMGSVKEKAGKENYFYANHDEHFMAWRLANPEGDYFYSGNSVFSRTHLPFFKSYLTSHGSFRKDKLQKLSMNPLKISIGLNLAKPSLGIDLPDKLKPSPLNLIFKTLQQEEWNVNSTNCYFELIDFDAY